MTTLAFWKAATERAAKSFAQSLLLLWAADGGLDMFHVDLSEALSFGVGAAVLSYLTSVASSGVGGTGPSLANEVTSPPAPPIQD